MIIVRKDTTHPPAEPVPLPAAGGPHFSAFRRNGCSVKGRQTGGEAAHSRGTERPPAVIAGVQVPSAISTGDLKAHLTVAPNLMCHCEDGIMPPVAILTCVIARLNVEGFLVSSFNISAS